MLDDRTALDRSLDDVDHFVHILANARHQRHVASLGEAFGLAVELFSESSDKLMETLQRIEGSLEKSVARSDEQLAYYVAQAREVIDLFAQDGFFYDQRMHLLYPDKVQPGLHVRFLDLSL
mgnify:CR=1 FL=1